MIDFQIIPAIDIIDGKCVRLYKGDYEQITEYKITPLEIAKQFEKVGIKKIHLVDLDGAKAKKIINLDILDNILKNTNLKIEFGGGIRTKNDIDTLIKMGVYEINIGSLAINNPELLKEFINEFGQEKFTIGVDFKDGDIKKSGWEESTGIDIYNFIEGLITLGIKKINVTDIKLDGTLGSPNFNLYKELVTRYSNLQIVASGGVSCTEDIKKIKEIGCTGVIVGKAIYEGKININELIC